MLHSLKKYRYKICNFFNLTRLLIAIKKFI